MPSVQRFLSGHNNLARAAALSASSVRPSTAIERVSAQRSGGGRVRLGGSYTGHEAATVDVEIIAAGGVPRASVPQFVGVGNGTLRVAAVDAAAPLQAITLTLADLGIATESAKLDVSSAQIVARTPGTPGNSIRITVTPNLVRSATAYALLSSWPASTKVQTGSPWDFGGLPLNSRSELDDASPRIQFGFDPQIYRPYRQYKDGAWQYGVSPALERDVAAGTAVFTVTGGYVVTVTDGAMTETYGDTSASQPAIVTFYDLLAALASSALVQVAGVVAVERTVGGSAAVDVPLRTQAWLYALSGSVKLQDVEVPANAPTQALTVRCINADVVGKERWSVTGDVSGELSVATTGVVYASSAANFKVPLLEPISAGSGEWSFKYSPVARDDSEGVPSVCIRPFRLGVNAKARTVTFRYSKRPPADCKCSDVPTPRVSLVCLGLDGGDDLALDANYQSRLEALYLWRSGFTQSNTDIATMTPAQYDMDFCDAVTQVFGLALAEIFEVPDALAEWDAALVAMKADLAVFQGMSGAGDDVGETAATNMPYAVDQAQRRYATRMDYCRTLAGIVPKPESSSSTAGSCWSDNGDNYWWVDVDGYYLPAFTNEGYVSARRDAETGMPYSTQEFGFGLVVACETRLKLGDEVTINIAQVDGDRPYQVGDEAVIQTVAAGPAWLVGGVDGTDEQTWQVLGSASGVLPDYAVPTDGTAAPAYAPAALGATLQLALGGIAFALGDQFTLAIEAGQYRWRQNEGAWSALADIPSNGTAALADGLTLAFDAGAAPSFVPGDAYRFDVHQPFAVSHISDAHADAWGWDGDSATLVIDLGSVQQVQALALARYQLPTGAAVSVETSTDSVTWGAPLSLDVSRAVAVQFVGGLVEAGALSYPQYAGVAARYLRVTVVDAPEGTLGWIWAGAPLATDHHASKCTRTRRWAVGRSDGINPLALYKGAGDGWSLAWSPQDASASRLLDADLASLLQLLNWAQEADEPLILVPHYRHPQEASLVRFGVDALEVSDVHAYQTNATADRVLTAQLELEPVYQ